MEEIFDQSEFISEIFNLHLQTHNSKVNPDCKFCKAFLINKTDKPLESHSFIILDMSDIYNPRSPLEGEIFKDKPGLDGSSFEITIDK